MADTDTKQNFQWLDLPDGSGGYERKWCKDADARAAIEEVESQIPSSASAETCEEIIEELI